MSPLFPVAHPSAGTCLLIHRDRAAVSIDELVELACQTEVADPTSHVAIEVGQATFHRDAPAAAGVLFNTSLEKGQFLRCDLDGHTASNKCEPEALFLDYSAGVNAQPRVDLTWLFCSLTTSFNRRVRYRWTDVKTRLAPRSLRTKMTKSSAYLTNFSPRRSNS
jgi:hypothetical protein